jgi:hypothetical protein
MQNSDLSYAEVLSCLEDAKQGLLSPYWQGYAERELDTLRDAGGHLPPDAEALNHELHSILASTPQISDHESIAHEVVAQGNQLVYDYHGTSSDAFAIIIYVPANNIYTASLALPYSTEAAHAEAAGMQEDLQKWLKNKNINIPLQNQSLSVDAVESNHYASIGAAVSALLAALNSVIK